MDSTVPTQALQLTKPSFFDVAKNIISRAFRSAICIDDEYASAYSDIEGLNTIDSKSLYYSFREQWFCDLDIHHFRLIEDSWKQHMLENKELMILDWELDPGQRFESTLTILDSVIQSKKIPFVVIYTNTEDLDAVSRNLFSTLNPIGIDDYSKFKLAFEKLKHICYEGSEYDFDTVKELGKELFFSYINKYSQRENLHREISRFFLKYLPVKEEHKDKLFKKILDNIKAIFKLEWEDPLIYLSFIFLREDNAIDSHSFIRIETADNAYLLNEAVTVLLFHKKGRGGIEPSLLFESFSKALINSPYTFLSLLSLEFKDELKENFNKIGAKFSSLDEQAFFYHMKNYRSLDGEFKIEEIYDFILKGWVSELYQSKIAENSKVLNYLSNRFTELDIESIQRDRKLMDNLLKYSAYISTIDLSSNSRKKLWFGDVFSNEKREYFLCITPHCDCVLPAEKLKNNFYFVKGVATDAVEHALKNAEKDFLSFIIQDGKPVCVEWKCKPFTTFIERPFIDTVKMSYSGKQSDLFYLVSLKENYAQRISNEAFSYGYRVGIDLPHISDSENGAVCSII